MWESEEPANPGFNLETDRVINKYNFQTRVHMSARQFWRGNFRDADNHFGVKLL